MTFAELVRLLEKDGFELRRENGSKRFYGKPGFPALIQVDFHGKKEVPRGTLAKILKDAPIRR
ncbi:type II toxin-antitoxin system HicA family toxin [Candidatus Binatia bacterium]|nr:type II toxin-antitoxin system HicA family toxin [Candidatus Binatia bacterium]